MNDVTGKELIDSRKDLPVYGDRINNMIAVAHIWTGILGFEVQPYQVPLMLAAMKIQRAAKTPEYKDSSDDVLGYMEIFVEVMGDDLIDARTVEEFRAKKAVKEEKVIRLPDVRGDKPAYEWCNAEKDGFVCALVAGHTDPENHDYSVEVL